MRKIRSEFNLKMNGYTNIDGKTGIILDCSNLTWHDSERHGAEVNISLKDHCIVISFDGEKYYMHLIYKKTNSDVTTPQMIPMFDDHMRSGAFDTKILRVFLYMIKKGIKIEEKDNSAEDLSYGSYDYIDKHDNYDPSFAPDRNPNITNTHYSKSYADNEKRRNGAGEWEMICHNTLLVVKTKVINGNLKN